MDLWQNLAVSQTQALRFFFERLKDVTEHDHVPSNELLYNASILAHFASTSTASADRFPPCPTGLGMVFDVFVLDASGHADSEIMEAAASQCLLLTGFFLEQQRQRHNVAWFASLGAGFFDQAAQRSRDRARTRMLATMAIRFEFWRRRQSRLAQELSEEPRLIRRSSAAETDDGP